ncbi:MAG: hypothetical protein ACKOBQ_04660 [Bacteroidota bacterium]
MRRASAWFGLVCLVWAFALIGLVFYWQSTSAKRTLAERIAHGEALERWVLSPSEYASLRITDGEFWFEGRIYDVMRTEELPDDWVAIQVFDDSHETNLAKTGRKLFKRKLIDPTDPPVGLGQWVNWHAVLPSVFTGRLHFTYLSLDWDVIQSQGDEAHWSIKILRPPRVLCNA